MSRSGGGVHCCGTMARMKLLEVVILHQWVGDLSQSFYIGFPPSQLVQDAVHCMKPHLNMFSVYPKLASLHLPGSTPGQNPNGRLTTPSQFAFGEARTWLCPPNKSSSQKTWLRSTRFSHHALCFVSALFTVLLLGFAFDTVPFLRGPQPLGGAAHRGGEALCAGWVVPGAQGPGDLCLSRLGPALRPRFSAWGVLLISGYQGFIRYLGW